MQLDKNIRTSKGLYIGGIQYNLQQSRIWYCPIKVCKLLFSYLCI